MLRKRSERIDRVREAMNRPASAAPNVDDDGVLIGAPDFIRNRVSTEHFNAKLAAGSNFRGYGLSVTPTKVLIKEPTHA